MTARPDAATVKVRPGDLLILLSAVSAYKASLQANMSDNVDDALASIDRLLKVLRAAQEVGR